MKKFSLWILILVLVLTVPALSSCDKNSGKGSVGLVYTVNEDGKTCSVSEIGSCTDTDIVIPKKNPDGYRVTAIEEAAFLGCSNLTSITIPDSVTSIGAMAFSNCSGLTSITIPKSVTNINSSTFAGCSGLTRITVSKGNTAYHSQDNCLIDTQNKTLILGCKTSIIPADGSVTNIGRLAFNGCSGLTSVTIPDSVTSIGERAFGDCNGLTRITVSNGNTVYHSQDNCLIDTKNKVLVFGCKASIIPADGSVTNIGEMAFFSCSGLTSITIPDNVTSIGDWAFFLCSGLTSITIPDSVTSIGGNAFSGCSGLTSVTLPDSVTSIGEYAFYECSSLTSITIPNNVTSIGYAAFCACNGLTSVTIPNSVTSIGDGAFSFCRGLTSITFNGTKEQWNAIKKDNWNGSTGDYTIYCSDGDIAK